MLKKIRIYPPVYMLLTALGIWLLHQYWPIYQVFPAPWNQLGLVFISIGIILDLTSLFHFVKAKTTVHPFREASTAILVTHGFYRFTRNPMYLGLLFLLIGWTIKLGTLSGWFLLPLFVFLLTSQQIKKEEKILSDLFGEIYKDYQAQVRRWL